MTDISEPDQPPALDWETAPEQFRQAHSNATEQLNRLKAEAAEAAQVRRENAMLRAGIDVNHPIFDMFSKAYSGKEDPEAIRTEFERLTGAATAPHDASEGSPPAETPEPGPPTEAERMNAALQEARGKLNTEAIAPGEEPEPHPFDAAMGAAKQQRDLGRSRESQMSSYLQTLFNAAVKGDPRVTSTNPEDAKEKWERRQGLR
jgi:hypothetical protein